MASRCGDGSKSAFGIGRCVSVDISIAVFSLERCGDFGVGFKVGVALAEVSSLSCRVFGPDLPAVDALDRDALVVLCGDGPELIKARGELWP